MHTFRNRHLYEAGLIECVCPNLPELRIVCELHDMQVRALLKRAVSDILLLVCVVRAASYLSHARTYLRTISPRAFRDGQPRVQRLSKVVALAAV